MKTNKKTNYRQGWGLGFVCLVALVTASCETQPQVIEQEESLKTAIAFYKALAEPTPQTEETMGMTEYRTYGYPAMVYGGLDLVQGVKKVQEYPRTYEVRIKFWCHGKDAAGKTVKLRRQLVVQLIRDKASSTGWSVFRFRFDEDKPLSLLRQVLTWLLWMFVAPILFFVALIPLCGDYRVAFGVALVMGMPIQVYVSYLCFGTLGPALAGIVVWLLLLLLFMMSWMAAAES